MAICAAICFTNICVYIFLYNLILEKKIQAPSFVVEYNRTCLGSLMDLRMD